MGIEIERKFLVPGIFPMGEIKYSIKQGYIDPLLGTIRIHGKILQFFDKLEKGVFHLDIGSDSEDILKNLSIDENGILLLNDHNVVRIRIRDEEGFITLKGKSELSGTPEYEYKIPISIAEELWNKFINRHINKVRHIIPFKGKTWEVDEFLYPIQITIAEVELSDIKEKIKIPFWVGDEVTGDYRYFNSEIIKMSK